ncbi:SDR family oxidoreductase [Mammaliicoccus sciuri]|uniref:SDR family oxidoreductase n=1 Tax=Mammaliicoccus sciuri TaxID=1296 RepID=UPI00069FAEDE|nr:SDR family oxidoreductase [Mammaliicoccus sciuri]
MLIEDIKNNLVDGQTFDHIHANFMYDEELNNIKGFLKRNGKIDYLVCNHALSGNDGYLNEISSDSLDMHWQINTKSSILLAKLFVEQHNKSNLGKIIFMTSGQSLGAMPNEISYALSKAALAEIVKSLAYDLSEKNITVNSVNPGVTNTGYLDEYDNNESWEEMKQSFPFGRFSEPEDAANIITFLLSDKGSWITGQTINSEGGFRRG